MSRVIKNNVLLLLLLFSIGAAAQKTVYIPYEWRNRTDTLIYAESDPNNKYTWSKSRSVESDNVIVFWDKGYGSVLPSKSPSAYSVDEQDLLKKCEAFYDLEINKLGFVDPEKSNLAKYKVMVLLNHTTDWVCYGGGYDFQISALWLGPSACKPVGHSVAHEVGHSFHYMCYAEHSGHSDSDTDNTGFHLACGNGQAVWEQTAQWQAAQSYPAEMFNQSIGVFRKSHNYAFSHEWHRYQSYWFFYYLCQYYNDLTTVAQVWNTPMTGQSRGSGSDFNRALMKLKNLKAQDLFRLYYDYAARCATWDFDVCAPYRNSYIGDFEYRCVQTGDKTYQVALASVPQSSGFNIIELKVPDAGTSVVTHFTALKSAAKLAAGDPAELLDGNTQWKSTNRTLYVANTNNFYRGFRLGYVALMNDGTRQYFNADSLYCEGTAEKTADVSVQVPEGTKRLWLIVTPAPKRYVEHKWTEALTNAEQWPYSFSLEGTDVSDKTIVYVSPTLDGREISNVTLTYDVYFPPTSGGSYEGTTVTVSRQAAATLGTALQMNISDIAAKMQAYAAAGPSAGKIMFYPCNPTTKALVSRGSTANGYGHWFNASGAVSDYDSGYVFSELAPASMTFNIGAYPGKTRNGQQYTIVQALRYKDGGGKEAIARFVFNVHIDNTRRTATLAQIDYNNPTGIVNVNDNDNVNENDNGVFDLNGRAMSADAMRRGSIYIVDGRKIIR